jgi:3-phenylpropionate/trans-cinnamate dioxygenase ferredoxin subunit
MAGCKAKYPSYLIVQGKIVSEFLKVARVEDVPSGERIYHDFEYETVIILNVDDEFYCIADVCTHDDGPLEDGPVNGHAIECPRHGACFDIRTGAVLAFPATSPIPTYQVKVEDGNIYIESPDD